MPRGRHFNVVLHWGSALGVGTCRHLLTIRRVPTPSADPKFLLEMASDHSKPALFALLIEDFEVRPSHSESEDEDDMLLILLQDPKRRRRLFDTSHEYAATPVRGNIAEAIFSSSDEHFAEQVRLSRLQFLHVEAALRDTLQGPHRTRGRARALSPRDQVLLFLYHCAHCTCRCAFLLRSCRISSSAHLLIQPPATHSGNSLRSMSIMFGVSLATVQRTVMRVAHAIVDVLGPQHVRWPSHAQHAEHAQEVEGEHGLPHVAGFIDGTHIRIVPQDARDRVYSFCRKGFHSIVLQAITDCHGRFLSTEIGYAGRVHDARVFCESPIAARIGDVQERDSYLREPFVLLGDAAYPLTSWLITPYASEASEANAAFNYVHSSARMAVERAFGKLKLQWSILFKNNLYGPGVMNFITAAACILHNITIDVDEEHGWEPPPDQLALLLQDDDAEPMEDDPILPGRDRLRNKARAGKAKRDMMKDAIMQ